MLLNHSSLSYIVFALPTAVNNLSNKTSIFHDFQGPTIKFHDFPGLEIKFTNSMTFQVFHDLYKPCGKQWWYQYPHNLSDKNIPHLLISDHKLNNGKSVKHSYNHQIPTFKLKKNTVNVTFGLCLIVFSKTWCLLEDLTSFWSSHLNIRAIN